MTIIINFFAKSYKNWYGRNGQRKRVADIFGTVNRGRNEIDTLTGGAGKDKFVLSSGSGRDGVGSSYIGSGSGDYALITDFNKCEDVFS